jgi:acyl carrier protein
MIDVNEVKKMIAEMGLSIDIENLDPQLSLKEQGIDSLDMMTFYLKSEERFGIEIPNEDIDKVLSIMDLVNYVGEKNNK